MKTEGITPILNVGIAKRMSGHWNDTDTGSTVGTPVQKRIISSGPNTGPLALKL